MSIETATPIPTPTGWTTAGELRPGLAVLDERGRPATVTDVGPSFTTDQAACVRFDAGPMLVLSDDHRLVTWGAEAINAWRRRLKARDRVDYWPANWAELATELPVPARPNVRTVREVGATLEVLHRVPVAGVLQLDPWPLPVSPWLLGAYCSSGRPGNRLLTTATRHTDEDTAHVVAMLEADGWPVESVRKATVTVGRRDGRTLDSAVALVGGRPGHLPMSALRSDVLDREALLAGVVDMLGKLDSEGRRWQVDLQDAGLIGQLADLWAGLGQKPTVLIRSRGWRLLVSPTFQAFKLGRKARAWDGGSIRALMHQYWTVDSVQHAGPVATMVDGFATDSATGLVLVGKRMVPVYSD